MIYVDFTKIKNLVEIPLIAQPNQQFNIFADGETFNIELRTFSDKTVISIWTFNDVVCYYAPINYYQFNLAFYSNFKNVVFFFLKNQLIKDTKDFNFLDFGSNKIRLFYGSI